MRGLLGRGVEVLNADPGVARAAVNLVTETAAVELAPGVDALEIIARAKSATEAKGFRMSPRPVGRAERRDGDVNVKQSAVAIANGGPAPRRASGGTSSSRNIVS